MSFTVLSRPWGKIHDVVVFEGNSLEDVAQAFYNYYEEKFLDQFSVDPCSVRKSGRWIKTGKVSPYGPGYYVYDYLLPEHRLRVVSHNDRVVSLDSLLGAHRSLRARRASGRRWYGPPGSKRAHYRYFRHPKTTQERRHNDLWLKEEGEPRPRCARNRVNLVNSWDDVSRSGNDRSWKNFRDHQWKNLR